jgi:hypothetical protein
MEKKIVHYFSYSAECYLVSLAVAIYSYDRRWGYHNLIINIGKHVSHGVVKSFFKSVEP